MLTSCENYECKFLMASLQTKNAYQPITAAWLIKLVEHLHHIFWLAQSWQDLLTLDMFTDGQVNQSVRS